jgi:hypothetical protein
MADKLAWLGKRLILLRCLAAALADTVKEEDYKGGEERWLIN